VENYYKASSSPSVPGRRSGIGRGIEERVLLGGATIQRLQLINERGIPVDVLRSRERVSCEMEVHFREDAHNPIPACFIRNSHNLKIYDVNATYKNIKTGSYLANNTYVFKWSLECNLLPGRYYLGVDLARGDLTGYYDDLDYGLPFEVVGESGARGIADLKAELSVKNSENMTLQSY
jgi:hypothetical protein